MILTARRSRRQRTHGARTPWLTVILLAAFILINHWDRAAFGSAALPIMNDLKLTHAQFGSIGGAFFLPFSACALIVGWASDRLPLKWLIASMATVWALAQMLMSVAVGPSQAFASRVALGAGEGPARCPSALLAAYRTFSNQQRSLITAMVAMGAPIGAASAALVIVWAVDALGWRAAFAAMSALSLVWTSVWILTQPRNGGGDEQLDYETTRPANPFTIPWDRRLTGVAVAAFGVYWVLALGVNWFPATLQDGYGLSSQRSGFVLAVAWILQVPVLLFAARLAQNVPARGAPSEPTFAIPTAVVLVLSGASLVAAGATPGAIGGSIFLALSLVCVAAAITFVLPLAAEISPVGRRGVTMGAVIAVASLGGLVAPVVFGKIVDALGGSAHAYRVALATSGVLVTALAPLVSRLLWQTRSHASNI